jgi:hypothetical protein
MIPGLRRFHRLIAQRGQDETVRLVEKGLMCGSVAMKSLGDSCGCGVLESGQKKQSEDKTEHEKTIACRC